MRPRSLFFIGILLCVSPTWTLLNVTIDDELGDSRTKAVPQYAPDGAWAQGSICYTCAVHPGIIDVSQTFDGTWHDSTHHPGDPDRVVSLTFTGVAIYVFHIIPNFVSNGTTTLTNLTFFLDHAYVGQFLHLPNNTTNIAYNVPVFVNASLPDGQHSLDIRATGPNDSLVLFDYAVYTSTIGGNTSAASNATKHRAAIIGGVIGGLAGLFLLIALLFIAHRRYRKQPSIQGGGVMEQTTSDPTLIPSAYNYHPATQTASPTTPATGTTRARVKGRDAFFGAAAHASSGSPTTVTSARSETDQSAASSNVQADLAAIREEITRLREQHVQMGSLPPPYEHAERGQRRERGS